jgi:hypothetical protein
MLGLGKMRGQVKVVTATLTVLATLAGRTPGQDGGAAAQPAALFAAARPHLEEVLGARLVRLPQFRVVTPADLARLPDGALEVRLRWQYPDLDEASRARAREAALIALRGASVAAHQEGTDVILVCPDNAAAIARWDPSLARARSVAFLQLALVHEAVRWVLDHRYGLAQRRAACRDSEELVALQAVVEGRAQWVTRQVARRLGAEADFPLLAEAYRRAPDGAAEARGRLLCHDVLSRQHWACERGLAFFDYLDAQGVADAEARAFAHPPRQVSRVERPELYLRAERLQLIDTAEALTQVVRALAPAEWAAGQQPWTPAMIRQAADLLGEGPRAEKVVCGWDEGRSLVWSARDNPARQVAVGLVRFQDAAGARSYFGLAVDLQRKQDELLNGTGPGRRSVVESRSQALRLAGADEAVRCDKRVQLPGKAEPVTMTQILARADDRVIEFTWQGLAGDTEWAQRVLGVLVQATRSGP